MSKISKNMSDNQKMACKLVIDTLENFKPSKEAKESFNRKPFYMIAREENLYGIK